MLRSIGCGNPCTARGALFATLQAVRPKFPALCEQRHLGISMYLDFPDQSAPAWELSGAARSVAVSVLSKPQGVGVFEGFDRSIERVGHVSLDTGDGVHAGTRPHTARRCLVVGEWFAGARIDAPDSQIAHRAGAGCGDS